MSYCQYKIDIKSAIDSKDEEVFLRIISQYSEKLDTLIMHQVIFAVLINQNKKNAMVYAVDINWIWAVKKLIDVGADLELPYGNFLF